MPRTTYFRNWDGVEVDEREALHNGILKDGYSCRIPTQLRDNVPVEGSRLTPTARKYWPDIRDTLGVVDARGVGGDAGNRPGWRILDSDYGREEKARAYADYQTALVNAWRGNPPTPTGDVDCSYERMDHAEVRLSDAYGAPHRQREIAYAEYARELANMWRMGK
jgi:hypothetical protein